MDFSHQAWREEEQNNRKKTHKTRRGKIATFGPLDVLNPSAPPLPSQSREETREKVPGINLVCREQNNKLWDVELGLDRELVGPSRADVVLKNHIEGKVQ